MYRNEKYNSLEFLKFILAHEKSRDSKYLKPYIITIDSYGNNKLDFFSNNLVVFSFFLQFYFLFTGFIARFPADFGILTFQIFLSVSVRTLFVQTFLLIIFKE